MPAEQQLAGQQLAAQNHSCLLRVRAGRQRTRAPPAPYTTASTVIVYGVVASQGGTQ